MKYTLRKVRQVLMRMAQALIRVFVHYGLELLSLSRIAPVKFIHKFSEDQRHEWTSLPGIS